MSRHIFFSIAVISLAPLSFATDEIDCDYYNEIVISDPLGDSSEGYVAYDIVQLTLKQIGNFVQFELLTDGGDYAAEGVDTALWFDLDQNLATGRLSDPPFIGTDLWVKIRGEDIVSEFFWTDAEGNRSGIDPGPVVTFLPNGFRILLESDLFPSRDFNLYFSTNRDWGSLHEIHLEEPRGKTTLKLESDNLVLHDNPTLVNIPNRDTGVELRVYLEVDGERSLLPPDRVTYSVYHPVFGSDYYSDSDPEKIISIDDEGVAHYNSEGFVHVAPSVDYCEGALTPGEFVIATGDVFGVPGEDDVIAVFPSDYTPIDSSYSFGQMMSSYPNYTKLINTAYGVMENLYSGYQPFNGLTQVFALLDLPDHCGSPGNPLLTAPCCYMDCGDGSPQYNVVVHEMGHNFQEALGMHRLLTNDFGRFLSQISIAGFMECSASLPIIYFEQEMVRNFSEYGFSRSDFEVAYYQGNIDHYCPDARAGLEEFEDLIATGQTDGIHDNPGLFDGVRVFCSFFQAFSCGFVDGQNLYHHEMIRRFLSIFRDSDLPSFNENQADTYFGAAYSLAAGRDMRRKLRQWGFEIDDAYYGTIMPLLRTRLPERSERPGPRTRKPAERKKPAPTRNRR
jgi:hypothetical protein